MCDCFIYTSYYFLASHSLHLCKMKNNLITLNFSNYFIFALILTLNIRLTIFGAPEGVVSNVLCLDLSTSYSSLQEDLIKDQSLIQTPVYAKGGKYSKQQQQPPNKQTNKQQQKNLVFIHLDDYRPLNRASDI